MPETYKTAIGSKEAAEIHGDASVRQFLRSYEKRGLKPVAKLDGIRGAFLWNRADVERTAPQMSDA